jgi:hypothetical protein
VFVFVCLLFVDLFVTTTGLANAYRSYALLGQKVRSDPQPCLSLVPCLPTSILLQPRDLTEMWVLLFSREAGPQLLERIPFGWLDPRH